jgi:hypothetical protein
MHIAVLGLRKNTGMFWKNISNAQRTERDSTFLKHPN